MEAKTVLKSRRLKRKSKEDLQTSGSYSWENSQHYDRARLNFKMRKIDPSSDSEQCVAESKENDFDSSRESPKYILTKAHRRSKDKKTSVIPPLGSLNENIEFTDSVTGFILSPQAQKPYHCHLCIKQFKYFSNLKSHMNIVHKKTIVQSDIDSKTPKHANGQLFQCDVCCRNFKYFSNLRTHRLVHTTTEIKDAVSD